MAIGAFNLPDYQYADFIQKSLKERISRFWWECIDIA
jgi:hypothetical protein